MGVLTWDLIFKVFLIFGGLGLFLFGMKIMSDGLENMAGDRLRSILEKATAHRFFGIIVGTVVTCIIQSSSATTVMVVGFVNASMLTLTQAISIIMGANIGTTITAQIISFKIDPIAPLCIFAGLVMHMFFKKRNTKNTGYILLGFGILFFGISTMGAPLKEFSKLDWFQSMLLTFQHPFLSLLAGIIFTAIIQSSSATTGIIVALYLGGVNLPFQTAAYLVLGSNIGTCITAMLASIAASRESKRAALAHVLFNVIGCIIFGTLIMAFPGILTWIQVTWKDGARQVAMFHTLFNVSTVVVLVGFIKQLAMLVHKVIPEIESENAATKKLVFLGSSIMQIPAIAVTQAQRELDRMGAMALENLQLALETFFTGDTSKTATVLEVEDTIDYLNHNITTWLVRIRGLKLSDVDMEKLGTMLHTVSDIERIGDHAENIVEYAMFEEKYGTKISQAAMDELRELSDATVETIKLALKTFKDRDASLLHVIDKLEQKVDDMSITCVENHIQRLQDEVCDPRGGVMFTDMVTDLERCADHANNIAYSILGNQIWSISRHKLLSADQWDLNANPKR
ncbi:MAG: Na/Pi cotransporter family protein [Peptococcaceae bacterium]|jgi:phosphate:Na+ symporter|nr:Na/Pi cotransporter family protein [Peptococcaceae bacterium]